MGIRIIKKSFWSIMFIHVAAFTAIGLFTARGWRLLFIFLTGLVVWMGIHGALYAFSRGRPALSWLNRYASAVWIFATKNNK